MVLGERALVVNACEVNRKEDYIYVEVIISATWEEKRGGGVIPKPGLHFNS